MGIKRLSYFLKNYFEQSDLSNFEGCTVGVDICGWIYQAYFCQLEYKDDDYILILRNILIKLKLFEKYNIKVQ